SCELPAAVRWLGEYVTTYRQVAVGGAIALAGALVAAWGARRAIADPLAAVELPSPRRRPSWRGWAAVALALLGHGVVSWHALRGVATPLDGLLFLFSLALIAVVVHRADDRALARPLGFRRIDGGIAAAIAGVVVAVNSIELTHWRFTSIGDEGAFFELAKHLAEGGAWSPFDLRGVYQTHPLLDSAYQAAALRVFGIDVIGWRLGEIVGLAVSALLLYALALLLFGRLPAVLAAVALGVNHHLMAFARIAYNNLHCVFWALLVLLLLALAWRSGRALFVYLAGCALGFCLYTFAVGLLVWPLVLLLVGFQLVTRSPRRQLPALWLLAGGLLLVVVPALLETGPEHLLELFSQQTRREVAATSPGLVARVSLVQSFLVFWVNPQWSNHYVAGPLLDPVTAALVTIGLAMGLMRLRAGAVRIGWLWFMLGLLMLALSNYRPGPFFTRLLFLIPACTLLAAMAVRGLETALRGLGAPRRVQVAVVLALVAAIPVLNLHQLLVASPRRLPTRLHALVIKALQEHPGRTVVEIGSEPDLNRLKIVDRYSELRERYRFATLDEVESEAAGLQLGHPPHDAAIYLAHEEPMVRPIEQALPGGYQLTTDKGFQELPRVWLFVPP
ncbi:MAG: glycosyltransferase family 39 protein, partial [Thermoanaerobaculia bacterium]|nr:glycosyltransferase family 39 protein [Thermoanaerobaculia bacterium]